MGLASLLNTPKTQDQLNGWSFSHALHHKAILVALQQKTNSKFTEYSLDPFNPDDQQNWLLRHQQMHDDFNSQLGLNGQDLQSVDLNNEKEMQLWTYYNFQEHQAAAQALAIVFG
jgi:hypothetical protein